MLKFHIISSKFLPTVGGMEQSILRIASMISEIFNAEIYIYVRNIIAHQVNNPRIHIRNIKSTKEKLLDPIIQSKSSEVITESYRLDYLLLKDCIKSEMERSKSDNILISFYISSTGFIAQQIANDLRIPHIASIRGTDYSLHFHNPLRIYSIRYVLQHADYIVTTNNEQLNAIRSSMRRYNISTIHNSVAMPKTYKTWLYKKNI